MWRNETGHHLKPPLVLPAVNQGLGVGCEVKKSQKLSGFAWNTLLYHDSLHRFDTAFPRTGGLDHGVKRSSRLFHLVSGSLEVEFSWVLSYMG